MAKEHNAQSHGEHKAVMQQKTADLAQQNEALAKMQKELQDHADKLKARILKHTETCPELLADLGEHAQLFASAILEGPSAAEVKKEQQKEI